MKGLVWSSSNKDIIKVNQNGVVIGLEKGTATITVSNADGLKAECTVTVTLNTDELENLVEEYKNLDLTKYEDGKAKDTFKATLKEAESLIGKATTQKEIDDMTKALKDAKAALKVLDYEELENLVNEYENLDLSKYEDGEAKDTFKATLKEAKALIGKATTQKEINDMVTALKEAKDNLKVIEKPEPPKVDKSKLEKNSTKSVLPPTKKHYSKENWKKYQKATC